MGRAQKQREEPEPESEEEEHSEVEELDEDDVLGVEDHQEEEQLHQQNQQLLKIIEVQCKEGAEQERLTWLALYSLKKQEIELTEKMQEEINLLKDKYDLLKQPIFADIGSAATGKKVDASLYKPQGVDCPANSDQITPSALPDYWKTVFLNSGLLEEEQDIEAFGKLSEFNCELIDPLKNHLKLTFTFSESPSFFTNKVLYIESFDKIENETLNHEVKIKEPIKWKGNKNENSVFFTLFDPKSNPSDVCELMGEFYRDFSNSIYFYMRKGDLEQIEDLQDDEEVEEKAKPSKKQKKQLEKPQCKQQ